jgi:hypothetical protein
VLRLFGCGSGGMSAVVFRAAHGAVSAALLAAAPAAAADAGSGAEARAWPVAHALPADPAALRAAVLAVHNRVRAAFGVAPLRWDESLAEGARAFAAELAAVNRLYHSSGREGENLWMGTRGRFSFEAMQEYWVDEGALFKPGRFPAVARDGRWESVGHFTQMIWGGTRAVGCAVVANDGFDVLVCRYDPPGNVDGHDPVAP